jgi:hypothetical protein
MGGRTKRQNVEARCTDPYRPQQLRQLGELTASRRASALVSEEKTAPNATLAGQGRQYLLSVLLTGFGNRGTCRG